MKNRLSRLSQRPHKVLLFFGIMHPREISVSTLESHLEKELGPMLHKSPSVDFSALTSYYEEESGRDLVKYLISFRNLCFIEDLYKIKLKTIQLEKMYSIDQQRIFNIDPGYLTLGKTHMFTTKDYSHRVYIKEGIFGEVNLIYSKKTRTYEACFGTYPDFQTMEFRSFLTHQRKYYAELLKIT